jgi:hypothetical protein
VVRGSCLFGIDQRIPRSDLHGSAECGNPQFNGVVSGECGTDFDRAVVGNEAFLLYFEAIDAERKIANDGHPGIVCGKRAVEPDGIAREIDGSLEWLAIGAGDFYAKFSRIALRKQRESEEENREVEKSAHGLSGGIFMLPVSSLKPSGQSPEEGAEQLADFTICKHKRDKSGFEVRHSEGGSESPDLRSSSPRHFLREWGNRRPHRRGWGRPFYLRRQVLFSEKDVSAYEEGKNDGDDTVHGKEGSVEPAEIVRFHQRMFVDQEQHNRDNAGECDFAETESWKQTDQKDQHDEMEDTRNPKRRADANVARNGMEIRVAIKFEILAGVEDVEAGHPESDGCGKQQDARIERTANRDPCGGWSNAQSDAEHQVRKSREALGIGIDQYDGESDRREPKREAV